MASKSLPQHLKNHVHVIISTLSGTQKALSYFHDTLLPFLEEHGIDYSRHDTQSTDTITELTNSIFLPEAVSGIAQTIILLSGDGGVVDLVNALASTPTLFQDSSASHKESTYIPPTLILIPMGTANALAHSSGIATDPLANLKQGTPKPLPLFNACFSPGARLITNDGRDRTPLPNEGDLFGAVVFSWGLHASLVAMSDTAEMRTHGAERFKIAAEVLLKEGHRYHGAVHVLTKYTASADGADENETWTQLVYDEHAPPTNYHSYILATLCSRLEEKFIISPKSQPLDGHLRLLAIPAMESSDIVRILGQAYQGGTHVEDPQVKYQDLEYGLRLEVLEKDAKWRRVCVDGKIVELEEGGWVEVRREKIGRTLAELVC